MKSQKKLTNSDINKNASTLIKNRYVRLGVIVFSGKVQNQKAKHFKSLNMLI